MPVHFLLEFLLFLTSLLYKAIVGGCCSAGYSPSDLGICKATDTALLTWNVFSVFLFLHEIMYCGYSLEASHQGTSYKKHLLKALLMSNHNIYIYIFHEEIRKNIK